MTDVNGEAVRGASVSEDERRLFAVVERAEDRWFAGESRSVQNVLMESEVEMRGELRGDLMLSAALVGLLEDTPSAVERMDAVRRRVLTEIREGAEGTGANVREITSGEVVVVHEPGRFVTRTAPLIIEVTPTDDGVRIAAE